MVHEVETVYFRVAVVLKDVIYFLQFLFKANFVLGQILLYALRSLSHNLVDVPVFEVSFVLNLAYLLLLFPKDLLFQAKQKLISEFGEHLIFCHQGCSGVLLPLQKFIKLPQALDY